MQEADKQATIYSRYTLPQLTAILSTFYILQKERLRRILARLNKIIKVSLIHEYPEIIRGCLDYQRRSTWTDKAMRIYI